MEYTFTNKIFDQEQQIELNNDVITFIGGNGSGKSSILEAIFQKYIENDEARVICFSSGQNELFTEIFEEHRRRNRRHLDKETNEISSFYFNKNWVRLLVFWSTMFRSNGLVRKYLLEKEYITINDLGDDASTVLKSKIRIRKWYADKIKNEKEKEERSEVDYDESGVATNLLSYSNFHLTLQRIFDHTRANFDFINDVNLHKTNIQFDSSNVYDIFTDKSSNRIFTFFAHATHGYHSQFLLNEFHLFFKHGREFKYLSDGEYQLLSIYALIDLFDNENTLFLLDEIDSHLYYENLQLMWKELKSVRGNVITTTHISESIINNSVDKIRFIENGKIKDDLKFLELAKRVSKTVGKKKFKYDILSRVNNAVIIDDHLDFEIIKALARKKLGNDYDDRINDITVIKIGSGNESTSQVIGRNKFGFVKGFAEFDFGSQPETKNIFLICDKDEYARGSINENDATAVFPDLFKQLKRINNNRTQIHLQVLRRREIENYLISPSLFQNKECLDNFAALFPQLNIPDSNTLDSFNDLAEWDAKNFIQALYNDPDLDLDLLYHCIDLIPASEISNDITAIHNYISSNL